MLKFLGSSEKENILKPIFRLGKSVLELSPISGIFVAALISPCPPNSSAIAMILISICFKTLLRIGAVTGKIMMSGIRGGVEVNSSKIRISNIRYLHVPYIFRYNAKLGATAFIKRVSLAKGIGDSDQLANDLRGTGYTGKFGMLKLAKRITGEFTE